MNPLIQLTKTLRRHWKKSTFAACAVAYGVNYGQDRYRIEQVMRQYCEEALKFGNDPISAQAKSRRVTVILNPVSMKKKGKVNFEKYCAPILHVAGLIVDVVQTDAEGQAKGLMEVMGNTDAVVIAGGDGTVSEAVTGLLRRADCVEAVNRLPLGALPLGRTNLFYRSIFGDEHQVIHMAEATLAVVKGCTKPVDVIRIEPVQESSVPEIAPSKPVFAVTELQWGAHRDIHQRRDKYWLWGPLRSYVAAPFCWLKSDIAWRCEAELKYVSPCSGCNKCGGSHLQPLRTNPVPKSRQRWWHGFVPKTTPLHKSEMVADHSKTVNLECGHVHTQQISTSDFKITLGAVLKENTTPEMLICIGPSIKDIGFFNFVSEVWSRERGNVAKFLQVIPAREIWLKPVLPQKKDGEEEEQYWLSIDQENFELKAMHLTLLPKQVNVFRPAEINNNTN